MLFFLGMCSVDGHAKGRVLLLSSYHPGFPTFFQQTSGVLSVLAPAGVSLDVEFMDSKRFFSSEHAALFHELLAGKLSSLSPYDVVMTADDNAFGFVLENRRLFHASPLVFFGVNNAGRARRMAEASDITGVIESASIVETARMARNITGSTTVLVVTDSTPSGQGDLAQLQARIPDVPEIRFVVLDLSRMTFASLLSRLDSFPANTPLLLLSAYRDSAGDSVDFSTGLSLLLKSGHPVFHMWEHGLGQGVVGGKVISHWRQGEVAARMALSILQGTPPADIRLVEGDAANRIVFDFDALTAHGFGLKGVPAQAEILNRPKSFLEKNALFVVPVIVVFIALCGTVAILWVAYRRTRGVGKQMKKEAEAFKSLFYENHSCMLLIDPATGMIRDANNAAVEFYGYSLAVLTSLHMSDINILPKEEVSRRMAQAVSGQSRSFQFIHRLADGQERNVEVYSGPVQVRGEKLLYSIVHDVTERIRASARLGESEERLRAIFESARDLIFIKDAQLRYTAFNPVMGNLFGDIRHKTDKEVLGGRVSDATIDSDARALSGQSVEAEIQLPVQDEVRTFHVIKTPLHDPQGCIVGLCGIARDVTERKRKDGEHKRALEEAEAANRAKDRFLANMSHELRTPLNGVFGMLQLMTRTDLVDEQKNYVGLAMLSSRNLLRIINDILDFSILKSGEMPLLEQEFDLCAIVRAVADSYSTEMRDKGLHLELEMDPDIPHLLVGDEAKLHQVLANIVGNAVKYTEKGSVRIRVDALGDASTGRYLIEVADTGIGIPEDKLDYVFEAFAQADDSDTRKYQGAGLGLGIVRHLVALMRGAISVTSKVGQGTSVYISLPFVDASPGEEHLQAVRHDDSLRKPMHVLIVDDDMLNLKMTERILGKLGHSSALAINGLEALSRLQEQAFDAVLMDIQMPVLDGISATRAIRDPGRYGARSATPIIALTAHAMQGDRERFLQAGMNGYLPKPVDLAALDRELSRLGPHLRDA